MNYKIAYINSRKDLKQVLQRNINQILITDKKLATKIINLKSENFSKTFVAIILLAISVSNFYNPVGWIAGLLCIRTVGYKYIASFVNLFVFLSFKNMYLLYFKYKLQNYIDPEDIISGNNIYVNLVLK